MLVLKGAEEIANRVDEIARAIDCSCNGYFSKVTGDNCVYLAACIQAAGSIVAQELKEERLAGLRYTSSNPVE